MELDGSAQGEPVHRRDSESGPLVRRYHTVKPVHHGTTDATNVFAQVFLIDDFLAHVDSKIDNVL